MWDQYSNRSNNKQTVHTHLNIGSLYFHKTKKCLIYIFFLQFNIYLIFLFHNI